MTDVGVVVLSMGNRPDELARLAKSLLAQRDVTIDVVVVGNGWRPKALPAGVRGVHLPENIGVPAGRNVGADVVDGAVLMFVDDDIEIPVEDVLVRARAAFDADPRLAVLQPFAADPDGSAPARRHVPRLRASDPARGGDVVWFWEGCSFVRRSAFDVVGGWAAEFMYGHEGIELAWRVIDAGLRVRYEPSLVVVNPPAPPFRGVRHQFFNARNRVWVARRNLPHPVLELYVFVWAVATFARVRSRGSALAAARGFVAGARQPAGPRRPISWRSVWRMTRLGRPPIV